MKKNTASQKKRCTWAQGDPLNIDYHDAEWGVPIYDDRLLFEFLILEGMQAGLSWITILKKRDAFRKAFANFDAKKIAKFDETKVKSLLNNAGIIRNKLKINAAIINAQVFLRIKKEYGSFANYIWQFTNHKPLQNNWRKHQQVPPKTVISDTMSKALKKEGFKFIGSTICYAFMQAVGMVNDHLVDCYRYKQVTRLAKKARNK